MDILHFQNFQFFMHNLIGITSLIIVGFLLSRIFNRNDVADVLWGLGFILLALINTTDCAVLPFRAKIILALTLIWGIRLSFYIYLRALKKPEDQRYANWRREWGKSEPLRAFSQVFCLQGVMLGIIALPVIWTIHMPEQPLTALDFLGVGLFLMGFVFETISDAQMTQFKKDPNNKGKILNTGLWAYSRHPNYFGEILIWWGMFFIALNTDGGLFTVVSPLLITFLLLKVSGVPMLEKLLDEKGIVFKNYVAQTPTLLPFGVKDLPPFFSTMTTLLLLDSFWLGYLMKDFYFDQLKLSLIVTRENPETRLWAAAGVYFFLALGIQYFTIRKSKNKTESVFKGAILGLATYSVYELTNLTLIKTWPLKMALVDVMWGTLLCAAAAATGRWVSRGDASQES